MSHISLTSKEEYHNLEIAQTDFTRDSGIYTLKATNISGENESNCEVKIEGSFKKSTEVIDEKTDIIVQKDEKKELQTTSVITKEAVDEKNIDSLVVEEKKDLEFVNETIDFKTELKTESAVKKEKEKIDSDTVIEKGSNMKVTDKNSLEKEDLEIDGVVIESKSSKEKTVEESSSFR